MKEVLLLFTRNSVEQQKAHPDELCDLLESAADGKIIYNHSFYEDLVHIINGKEAAIFDSRTNRDISSYDLVYQRRCGEMQSDALACAIYLKHKKIPFVDLETYQKGSINKLTQHWRLWEANLPFPSTVYIPVGSQSADNIVSTKLESLGWPLIVKGVEGTRGSDNYLAKNHLELSNAYQKIGTGTLIQQYIPNKGDYRVLIAEDVVLLIVKRVAQEGSHKNNISQGALAELVKPKDLPRRVLRDCINAAECFERTISGVDLVIDSQTGKHYFFEVNRAPQIERSSFSKEKAVALNKYIARKLRT